MDSAYYVFYVDAPFVSYRKVAYVTKSDKGSEILADASATLAAALVLGVSEEPAWRENALNHARALYDWAKTDPGSYRDAKSEGLKMMADMYPSGNGFWDDLSWAATWMYKATGTFVRIDRPSVLSRYCDQILRYFPICIAASIFFVVFLVCVSLILQIMTCRRRTVSRGGEGIPEQSRRPGRAINLRDWIQNSRCRYFAGQGVTGEI